MQNKGLIKLFALMFGLVSVYQLSFTFKANQVEDNAAKYATSKVSESQADFDKQRNIFWKMWCSTKNLRIYA